MPLDVRKNEEPRHGRLHICAEDNAVGVVAAAEKKD